MYIVITSVIILFALAFLGFFLGKADIIKVDAAPHFSNLVLKITCPATVFVSIVGQKAESSMMSAVGMILLCGLCLHIFTSFIGFLLVKIVKLEEKEKGIWMYACMVSNDGFMGMPLSLSIFGSFGMFMMALKNIYTNILIFTFGSKLITRGYPVKNTVNVKNMIINPINVAVAAGLICFFTKAPVPTLLTDFLGYLAPITSGLSMVVVGLSLARTPIKEIVADKKMFIMAAVRLLAIPLMVIGILAVLPFEINPVIKSVIILSSAMPASSAQSMLAEQYGTNTVSAGRSVFITTLLSVITIPIIMAIAI